MSSDLPVAVSPIEEPIVPGENSENTPSSAVYQCVIVYLILATLLNLSGRLPFMPAVPTVITETPGPVSTCSQTLEGRKTAAEKRPVGRPKGSGPKQRAAQVLSSLPEKRPVGRLRKMVTHGSGKSTCAISGLVSIFIEITYCFSCTDWPQMVV